MSGTIGRLAAPGRRRRCSTTPATVGEHPQAHLAGYAGILQTDAYDGYNQFYLAGRHPGPILEAACWVHARRPFFVMADLAENARRKVQGKKPAVISPLALEAVRRIDALFEIERGINGDTPERRRAVRQELSEPLVAGLETWMRDSSSQPQSSSMQISPLPGRAPVIPHPAWTGPYAGYSRGVPTDPSFFGLVAGILARSQAVGTNGQQCLRGQQRNKGRDHRAHSQRSADAPSIRNLCDRGPIKAADSTATCLSRTGTRRCGRLVWSRP